MKSQLILIDESRLRPSARNWIRKTAADAQTVFSFAADLGAAADQSRGEVGGSEMIEVAWIRALDRLLREEVVAAPGAQLRVADLVERVQRQWSSKAGACPAKVRLQRVFGPLIFFRWGMARSHDLTRNRSGATGSTGSRVRGWRGLRLRHPPATPHGLGFGSARS